MTINTVCLLFGTVQTMCCRLISAFSLEMSACRDWKSGRRGSLISNTNINIEGHKTNPQCAERLQSWKWGLVGFITPNKLVEPKLILTYCRVQFYHNAGINKAKMTRGNRMQCSKTFGYSKTTLRPECPNCRSVFQNDENIYWPFEENSLIHSAVRN